MLLKLITLESISFTVVVAIARFVYKIHLFGIIFRFYQKFDVLATLLITSSLLITYGMLFMPFGTDTTLQFSWI